jgi:hypothetical protein
MEKDLNIIKKILLELNYTPKYAEMLLDYIKNEFDKSTLSHITPQFLYVTLIFEEGRAKAKRISEYFEDMKKHGSFKNNVDKSLENSPTFKKYK